MACGPSAMLLEEREGADEDLGGDVKGRGRYRANV
jgi:hypothetical protein